MNEPPKIEPEEETFRDRIGIISREGRRLWIYPKKPSGRYHRARTIVSVVLLIVLFGLPLITIDGHPLVLLNIVERKFILFGLAFWPQDFYLFALIALTSVLFIILFTAIFGRVWCGWACPQTVFMEMVFRKIEYWIEGDGPDQYRLDRRPWDAEKVFRKTVKLGIFFFISWVIGNTLLAYIIGRDALFQIIREPIREHTAGFTAMTGFSLVFFGIFARFREQACVFVCPYGRLQSVLLDKNSIVVMYDHRRGEPRGKIERNGSTGKGDCVDCRLCVQVCPTGIDIRNGTQMECVNCTACMDACDRVMEKTNRPKGLIRYASENQIELRRPFQWTPRILWYSFLLSLLGVTTVGLVATRSDIQVTILRAKGPLYQIAESGAIRNIYTVKILNKTFHAKRLEARLEGVRGTLATAGARALELQPDALIESAFIVDLPPEEMTETFKKIRIGIYENDERLTDYETSFIGPIPHAEQRR